MREVELAKQEIEKAAQSGYWGELTFVFREGVPHIVRRNQTERLSGETTSGNRRNNHG